MGRRLVIAAAIIVAVIVIALLALPALVDVNRYRPTIQAELGKKLNRPVTVGQLSLRLFPFSIRAADLTIGEPAGFTSSLPFAKATDVSASASLFSIIRHQPDIKSLSLERPQIELIRNAQGVWNFAGLGGANRGGTNAAGATGGAANNPQRSATGTNNQQDGDTNLTLKLLKITDGQVAVTDELARKPRAVYDHIDAQISDFSPGRQFGLEAKVHFPGQGKELLALTGKGGPLQGNTAAVPFTGHLSLQEIALAGLNSFSGNAIPPQTDATITGDAEVASANASVTCKGNMKFDSAMVRGAKLAYPVEVTYDLGLDANRELLQVRSGSVKMGPTAMSLSGTIDQKTQPSLLDVRLTTNNASIVELSRLASAFNVAFDPGDQVKGSISADLAAKGPVSALAITGTLTSPTLQAQEFVLSNVHANCKMVNGVVDLAPVTATAYGGSVNGVVTVDTKPAHPQCSVKAKLAGVDANGLLSAATSVKNTLYGSLAADANLGFTIDSSSNLARTLNGTLSFDVTNGQLKNINMLNELSRIGKFVGRTSAQSGSGTALKKFSGTFNITNGIANTNNLVGTLDEGSLAANGSLNLVNQGIDMHVTAVLASGVSQTVGGSGVGGFLNTALANKNGELVLPVLVTGTTEKPIVSPDVQALAKMKLNNLLPTSGDPSKLTTGLIGSVVGKKGAGGVLNGILGGTAGQQNQQQKNQQQQNPINSILNQFGKKKKQ